VTTFEVVGYGTASLRAVGTATRPGSAAGTACIQLSVLWQASVSSPVVDPPLPSAI
jgi:hypothetical protein